MSIVFVITIIIAIVIYKVEYKKFHKEGYWKVHGKKYHYVVVDDNIHVLRDAGVTCGEKELLVTMQKLEKVDRLRINYLIPPSRSYIRPTRSYNPYTLLYSCPSILIKYDREIPPEPIRPTLYKRGYDVLFKGIDF